MQGNCLLLALWVTFLVGCSQRDPTADRAATGPGESAAESASKPLAAASPAPAPDPPKPLADLAFTPSFRRWAMICSKEAQRAGLGDLVTAELGSLKGLKLVEREQLEAATKELELAAVGESPATATRLKMGQLLGADALLMLSLEGSDPKRALKVVVSECLCGARLRIAYLPYDRSKAAGLPRACAEIVVQVCGQFAGGIRGIVGVSPLLSKNLVHDYDFLQAVYARLLEAALTQVPGVAVIEIEEARAIGRETSLGGAAPRQRPTPLLVEGEYTVSRGKQADPDVQFEFACQEAGGRRRTVRPPAMPLSATARFIVNDLPPQVLPPNDAAPSKAVSVEEQARWLTARGDAFAQVGDWEQAAELLEAAVLLAPEDLGLRLKLLAGYSKFLVTRRDWLSGRPKAEVRAHVPKMIEAHLAYLGHVEYLIRNRRLNAIQAVAAFETPFPFCVWPMYHDGNSGGSSVAFRDLFQPVADTEERFLLEVYPQILQLPAGRAGENPEFSAIFHERHPFRGDSVQTLWLGGLVAWFVKEKTSGFEQAPTPHDLNFLFRYLTEVVPDGCGTPRDLIQLLDSRGAARNQAIGRGPDAISGDDWVAFLRRLAASKHRMASLWGRYGLLHRQCEDRRQRAKAPDLSQSLLAEVEAWLKDYGDVTGAVPDRNPKLQDDLCRAVNTMHNQLVYELKPPAPVAVRRPPPTPPAQQAAPPAASQSPPAVARLRFEEIELQGFTADGFDGLLACGENCDVLWQEKAVAIIGKQGAREIRPLETSFFKVYWDGRNIWIATRHEGIWVLSTEGRILTKIGAGQGLPPADRGLLLHFLAPGKACAAGSFGEHSRAWVAIIEFGAGGAKVNVFHQATHLPPAAAFGPKNLTDPELVFTPRFFCDYDAGNGSPRLLLLGRGGSFPLPLLAIDPGTLQVSEFTDPSGKQFGALSDSYTNRKGEILRIEGGIVKQLARPGSTLADGNTARPLVLASADEAPRAPVERPRSPAVRGVRPEPILDANAIRGSRLLEYRGAIYVPGLVGQSGYEAVGGGRYLPRSDRSRARWFRIDPETFRAEVLDLGPSYPGQPCWYSVSSHYGLVGGCRAIGRSPARFFRVSVAEAGKDGAAPAPEGVGPGFRAPLHSGLAIVASSESDLASADEPAAGPKETRTWTSASGKFNLQARLVEAGKEAVVLEKEGGARVTVPRAKLSRADLDYLAGHSAGIPGADNPRAFIADEFRKRRLEYGMRIYRQAYLKVGKRDPAWDAAALALLDAAARYEAYRDLPPGWVYDNPSDEELRALMANVREKGCDDPLVFSLFVSTLAAPPWGPALTQTALRMLDELRQRHYPPIHAANLARKVRALGGSGYDKALTVLLESLVEAACAEEYQDIDRRFLLKSIHDDLADMPGGIQQLAARLPARTDADPWLAGMLTAEVEIVLGLRAKDPGRFPSLVPLQREDPTPHWQTAVRLLNKAWMLHRDYPEAAVMMIPLADISAAPENAVRLWFERAAAAQFDWTPAYNELGHHLLTRGDLDGLYAFGVECLKTGRYDTDVPWRFLVFLDEIRRAKLSDAFWRQPDVYANIREFFRGNALQPRHKNMDLFHAEEALFAYCTAHFDEARAALDKAGNRLDKSTFRGNTRDAEESIARIYALTGPLAAQTQAMEKAASAGEAEKAAAACRRVLRTLKRDDKARPYFRKRLVTAEIEARFASGEWVPIQPDADLAAWSAESGHWSVDEQGRLVGTWDSKEPCAGVLVCHARINPNFELAGHAEVLDAGGWAGFGAVLSFQTTKNFWECIFYPPLTAGANVPAFVPQGNRAFVRCVTHDTRHMRAAKVARSDDFRVQVFDGRVATTVGAEIARPGPPLVVDLDHDPPSGDMRFGVCVNRGLLAGPYAAITNVKLDPLPGGITLTPRSPTMVRFTGLKVRKMIEPPAMVRAPQPE